MSNRNRALIAMLRAIGTLDLTAIVVVLAPLDWIDFIHRWLGMGEFPHERIAIYLARIASLWFALYGLLLWFVSFDVQKYSELIRLLAWILIAQGIITAIIDLTAGMPAWWTLTEGLVCSAMGVSMFWLQQRTITTV